MSSPVVTLRVTTPEAVPSAPPTDAITVRDRVSMTPLVVRVLLAQRRLALEDSVAMATHPSALDRASARSTVSCRVRSLLKGLLTVLTPGWC